MRADQMTFGIEIECMVPSDLGLTVGHYHMGSPIVVEGFPAGWTAQRDGSIRALPGYTAVEIVSPVLRGREGIEQVIQAVTMLNQWGARVNASCGFHVHVGAGFHANQKALTALISLVGRFETALYAITGSANRAEGAYARPCRELYREDRTQPQRLIGSNRYVSLNLNNLTGSKRTVEFRVFQGTTNVTKILGYIQVCLALAENAHEIKRLPKYTCTNKRHQNGRGLVYRMLRNFNWYSEKSMGDRRFGMLTPDWLDAIKAEFARLADKYDQAMQQRRGQ